MWRIRHGTYETETPCLLIQKKLPFFIIKKNFNKIDALSYRSSDCSLNKMTLKPMCFIGRGSIPFMGTREHCWVTSCWKPQSLTLSLSCVLSVMHRTVGIVHTKMAWTGKELKKQYEVFTPVSKILIPNQLEVYKRNCYRLHKKSN